jgi:redox-sensitive bicupin YhaK (pirin superfamily)
MQTYYSFSFADYYDPEHIDFGPLKVLNEERIKPGKGYTHPLQDEQLLIYVIEGELRHRDSLGNEATLRAGSLQCLCAGSGASDTELNSSMSQEVHLLHIRISPASVGLEPAYAHKLFSVGERRGKLHLLASADGTEGSLIIHQDARIYGGLFHEAERTRFELSPGRRAYVHVARGSIAVNETRLNTGDGVKLSTAGAVVLQHGRDADLIVFDVPADQQAVRRPPASRPRSSR